LRLFLAAVTIGLFLASPQRAAAADLMLPLYIYFEEGCESGSGFAYFGDPAQQPGNATEGFERVSWTPGSRSPLELLSYVEHSGSERLVARRARTLTLLAADGTTVLLEKKFIFKTYPERDGWVGYQISIGVACHGVPYTITSPWVEPLVLDVHFTDNCPETSGFWHAGEPSLGTDVVEEELWPATWSPDEPITWDIVIPYRLSGGPPPSYPFTLLAADGETILFQRHFDFGFTPSEFPVFDLQVWLDCDTTPYREVTAPNTAVPQDRSLLTGVGLLALSGAALIALRGASRVARPHR
jgi:hypothetical protein